MTEKRWKRKEREVARMLGGTRNVEKGVPQPDVEGPDFVAQVKDRHRLPNYVIAGLADAMAHATVKKKQFPLLVLTTPTMKAKIVCMAHADFLKLWNYRYTRGGRECQDDSRRTLGKSSTRFCRIGTGKIARNVREHPRR